ncbi:MAG TPA: hypothetical protein VHE78_04060 [Gemmatimonadaceae bacterium]|nr:hypothetical protein [Gemmatimonadaceae bacterium]
MARSRGRLGVASLVLALCAGGCTSMQIAKGSPPRIIADKQPSEIEIRKVDGSRIRLYKPVVRRDTIWGSRTYDNRTQDRVVALSEQSGLRIVGGVE